jgi:hypothetical protein
MDFGILMIQDSILVCSPDPRIPHTADANSQGAIGCAGRGHLTLGGTELNHDSSTGEDIEETGSIAKTFAWTQDRLTGLMGAFCVCRSGQVNEKAEDDNSDDLSCTFPSNVTAVDVRMITIRIRLEMVVMVRMLQPWMPLWLPTKEAL